MTGLYPSHRSVFICGQVGTSKSSDMLAFYCFSTDFRYTFDFIGRKEYIPEASELQSRSFANLLLA
jgi:hypothetical protein